jgi:hypothetical protein
VRTNRVFYWGAATVLLSLLLLGVGTIGYFVAGEGTVGGLLFGALMTSVSAVALWWLDEPRRRTPTASPPARRRTALTRTPYPGVVRAHEELDQGRLWKARDRLHGVLQAAPADQETLVLLGEIYFRMGDLPNAGRYWFLTEREGADVDEAFAALHERYPFPELLRWVPARAPIDEYPAPARARLAELRERASRAGVEWREKTVAAPAPPRTVVASLRDGLAVAAFLALGPGLWLLGFVALIGMVVE